MSRDISYNSKIFRSISNTPNGEVGDNTVFYCHQSDNIIWAEQHGGSIVKGSLIGKVDGAGILDFAYQHINIENEIKIGKCISTTTILSDGKIRLSEKWQWLNGDNSSGESIIEEI